MNNIHMFKLLNNSFKMVLFIHKRYLDYINQKELYQFREQNNPTNQQYLEFIFR